jgi:hypothetical protein
MALRSAATACASRAKPLASIASLALLALLALPLSARAQAAPQPAAAASARADPAAVSGSLAGDEVGGPRRCSIRSAAR